MVALAFALVFHFQLRRVRTAQRTLLGGGCADLVDFAVSLQGRVDGLHRAVDDLAAALGPSSGGSTAPSRSTAVVRYDAYENTAATSPLRSRCSTRRAPASS